MGLGQPDNWVWGALSQYLAAYPPSHLTEVAVNMAYLIDLLVYYEWVSYIIQFTLTPLIYSLISLDFL